MCVCGGGGGSFGHSVFQQQGASRLYELWWWLALCLYCGVGAMVYSLHPALLITCIITSVNSPPALHVCPFPTMCHQAITWAWELSTKVYGLPVEKVWVSAAASFCHVQRQRFQWRCCFLAY